MAYLAAAVVLVGFLCALDLLITFGVLRRLREHTQLLGQLMDARVPEDQSPERGSSVPAFTAIAVDGTELSRERFTGAPYAVAFLSTDCPPCREQLPEFERYARQVPGGRDAVIAVITGTTGHGDGAADTTAEFVERLRPVAHVVADAEAGSLTAALSVSVWPVFLLVDEHGVVSAASHATGDLPAAPGGSGVEAAAGQA